MKYPIFIHKDESSAYGVIVPDLPGCFSAGDTVEEAVHNAHEAIECHLEGLLLTRILDKLSAIPVMPACL